MVGRMPILGYFFMVWLVMLRGKEDRGEGDECRCHMAVVRRAPGWLPIVHHGVDILKASRPAEAGHKPCCGPSVGLVKVRRREYGVFRGRAHRSILGTCEFTGAL